MSNSNDRTPLLPITEVTAANSSSTMSQTDTYIRGGRSTLRTISLRMLDFFWLLLAGVLFFFQLFCIADFLFENYGDLVANVVFPGIFMMTTFVYVYGACRIVILTKKYATGAGRCKYTSKQTKTYTSGTSTSYGTLADPEHGGLDNRSGLEFEFEIDEVEIEYS